MAKRNSNDHYAERAKQLGYPARSVFKLEEIMQKNSFIKKEMTVLDLGAAPGSWSLYLARQGVKVVALDLKPLTVKHPNITALQGDMFSAELAIQLSKLAPFDVVVSDAAPATSGDRLVDASRSHELAEMAFNLALTYLKPQGSFLVKVFQNGDELELLKQLKANFKEVKVVRPQAVRSESFECYFLAKLAGPVIKVANRP
ncbi:MAG: RlmE family RNA methyltransferase [Spirochaetaceae bacterium]|nr:RlmE family RNA methyltransferase [Spirochaetaceae bacterium]